MISLKNMSNTFCRPIRLELADHRAEGKRIFQVWLCYLGNQQEVAACQ